MFHMYLCPLFLLLPLFCLVLQPFLWKTTGALIMPELLEGLCLRRVLKVLFFLLCSVFSKMPVIKTTEPLFNFQWKRSFINSSKLPPSSFRLNVIWVASLTLLHIDLWQDSPLVYQTCYICLNSNLDLNWELHNLTFSLLLTQSNWHLNENINFSGSHEFKWPTHCNVFCYPFRSVVHNGSNFAPPGNIW